MDDTDRVLRRLARIEQLRATAAPATLLEELRALVPEAEAWARVEGDGRARAAAQKLREEAEGMR
jgi:Tfp pilus assembly protein PilN